MWLYSLFALLAFSVLSSCYRFVPLYVIQHPDLRDVLKIPYRGKAGGPPSEGYIIYPDSEIKIQYRSFELEINGYTAKVKDSAVTVAEKTHFKFDVTQKFLNVRSDDEIITSDHLLRLDETERTNREVPVDLLLVMYVDVKRFIVRNMVSDDWKDDLLGLYWMDVGKDQILRPRPLFGVRYNKDRGVFISNTGTSENLYAIRVLGEKDKIFKKNYHANPISIKPKISFRVSVQLLIHQIKYMMDNMGFSIYCVDPEHQKKILGILNYLGKKLLVVCHEPGKYVSFEATFKRTKESKFKPAVEVTIKTSVISDGKSMFYKKDSKKCFLKGSGSKEKVKLLKIDEYIDILHGGENIMQDISSNVPSIVFLDFEENFGRPLEIMLRLVLLACSNDPVFGSQPLQSALRHGRRTFEVSLSCSSKTATLKGLQTLDKANSVNVRPISLKQRESDDSVEYACDASPCPPKVAYLENHSKQQNEEPSEFESVVLKHFFDELKLIRDNFILLNGIGDKSHDEAQTILKGKEVEKLGLMIGNRVVFYVENLADEPLPGSRAITLRYKSNVVCGDTGSEDIFHNGYQTSVKDNMEVAFLLSCNLKLLEKDDNMKEFIWLRYLSKNQLGQVLEKSSETIFKYCGYDDISAFSAYISEKLFGFQAMFDCKSEAFLIWGSYRTLQCDNGSFDINKPEDKVREVFFSTEGDIFSHGRDHAFVRISDENKKNYQTFGRPISVPLGHWHVSLSPSKVDPERRIYKPVISEMIADNPNLIKDHNE